MSFSNVRSIRRAAVIGAGLMGQGIAQLFGRAGIPVYVTDSRPDRLVEGLRQIRRDLKASVKGGLLEEDSADTAVSLIKPVRTIQEAAEDADFVTECITESLRLKQRVFEELEASAPANAIFATNTSSLSLSDIGRNVRRKSRLIVTHYFNPPHVVPIVEVVPSRHTNPVVTDTVCKLLSQLGKRPVLLKKAKQGFLINRVQCAIAREVLSLLEEGVVDPEEMDVALMGTIGFRLCASGPLKIMDFGGLDVWLEMMRNVVPDLSNRRSAPEILRRKVAAGGLGLKSGKGFYDWSPGRTTRGCAALLKKRDEAYFTLLKLFYRQGSAKDCGRGAITP
jgi:3-hydroxybutyryl-CoA dehydrogenase